MKGLRGSTPGQWECKEEINASTSEKSKYLDFVSEIGPTHCFLWALSHRGPTYENYSYPILNIMFLPSKIFEGILELSLVLIL